MSHCLSMRTCLCVGVAVATVDKVGRRPLLLGGVAGLVLSLLALSGAQGLVRGGAATWISVAGLLAYTASYQVMQSYCNSISLLPGFVSS